jgi:hypothetical protein
MHYPESVEARAGGLTATFTLDWYNRRWTSQVEHEIADFPFIAEVCGKRYELYGDGTFDEEEVLSEP